MTLAHATVEELRALLEEATPGDQWTVDTWCETNDGGWAAVGPHHRDDGGCEMDGDAHECAKADAALLAALLPALPAMLDRLERAEKVSAAARGVAEHTERIRRDRSNGEAHRHFDSLSIATFALRAALDDEAPR